MNNQQSADDAWREVCQYRSDFENARWSSVYTERAITYAGRKGIASAGDSALRTHYAKLFILEYIRLQNMDNREREADKGDGLSELEKMLYASSDALADESVRLAGLPMEMSMVDAMTTIRDGMGEVVTKQRKQHHAMSDETRAELLAEIEARKVGCSDGYKTTTDSESGRE